MKILIVSDTHGYDENLEKVLKIEKPIDLLVHLGDIGSSEEHIRMMAESPCQMIAGNNDFFSRLERELEIKIGPFNALITHGHYYYVTVGTENLRREGIARNKDIVMFGHTHRPYLDISDKLVVLNPGSLSFPRQDGKAPTYIIMEINENGKAEYVLKEVGD